MEIEKGEVNSSLISEENEAFANSGSEEKYSLNSEAKKKINSIIET